MIKEKTGKIISASMLALTLALALIAFCPSFSTTSKAADNNFVWRIIPNMCLYEKRNFGETKSVPFAKVDLNRFIGSYSIPSPGVTSFKQLKVTYPSFYQSFKFNDYYSQNSQISYYSVDTDIFSNTVFYLQDNNNNIYNLEKDGGSFIISNPSNINSFSLHVKGVLNGTVNVSKPIKWLDIYFYDTYKDIIFEEYAPTITDSEGMEWTVPDGIENPIVVRRGTIGKYLFDGASGLCYFENPKEYGKYIFGSNTAMDVPLYMGDILAHTAQLKKESSSSYGIEEIYCSNTFEWTEFLYGTLPEIEVTPKRRTITDSEGTVWIVPDEIKNPVVVRHLTYGKYLIDAAEGLCYFRHPSDSSKYLFGSNQSMSVSLYQDESVVNTVQLRQENAADLGINPVYCSYSVFFTEFLYGSIPEIQVTPLPPTITDSEGTVWTIPDGIENPVVIRYGTVDTQKLMLDAVTGLGYFQNPNSQDTEYILGATDYIDANLYDLDQIPHKALLREDYAAELGINPIYCTHMWHFTAFLYGSLPELEITVIPPDPPDPPVFEDMQDFGTVKIGADENGNLVKEGTVYVSGGVLVYETKNADFVSNSEPTGFDYIRHAVIEDYCPKFIGRFTLNVDVDGYVSMQFPDLYLMPEMVKPEEYTPMDADKVTFPSHTDQAELALLSEWSEPIVVLYADGKKYYVSPYGGNVRIPVNKGENIVLLEIGMQVKDEFLSNHEGYIQAVYEAYLEDFSVYIREYQDKSAMEIIDELKKQTDALTKYDGSDKMDSDRDKLNGAIKDYDDVSNSLFESAGEGIGKFDVASGFEFNSQVLSSISFLGTIITSIITALGDFSMLYTIGVCMVLVAVVIGLYKFFKGGDD